jgi:formylglycine-generating enzyme required for sulfatase activity
MMQLNGLRANGRRFARALAATLAMTFAVAHPPQSTAARPHPGARPGAAVFRDCPDCPEMRMIPAGSFLMGSPPDEPGRQDDEGAPRRVTIGRAFALALYDVTRGEYAQFVAETGYAPAKPRCDWRRPTAGGAPFDQTPKDPVVCVGWQDATAYVEWLSRRTHRAYRLPTEAEWEYAARAGTQTARPWGSNADPDFANTGAPGCCGPLVQGADRWAYTSPVGSFPPNRFGLFDMIGDVWQWTADCGDDPATATTATAEACTTRVAKGGGWFHSAELARSAARVADKPDLRVDDIGFRVARSL